MNAAESVLHECRTQAQAALSGAPDRRSDDLTVYLANVVGGVSMRAIARAEGATPSTVLRKIRRVETLRDDPLLDRLLTDMETRLRPRVDAFPSAPPRLKEPSMPKLASSAAKFAALTPTERTALSRLAESEAFLLVAEGAEKAGIFSPRNDFQKPISTIPVETASRFAANDWVRCVSRTDLSRRYTLTAAGRAALRRRLEAERPASATGFAEAPSVFSGQQVLAGERRIANPETGEIETIRVNLGESPLGWLSKRRDARGECLLQPEELEAGERLREDYEMAQMGPRVGQDWRRFLTPNETRSDPGRTPSEGPLFARERVAKAVETLGPGLSDAAIRICCFLEGLEATEKRMGWSARSGKVVLKLALQRLVDHYGLMRRDAGAGAAA